VRKSESSWTVCLPSKGEFRSRSAREISRGGSRRRGYLFGERQGRRLYVLPGSSTAIRRARVEGERLVALEATFHCAISRPNENSRNASLASWAFLRQGEELEAEDAVALVEKLERLDIAVEGRAHEAFRLHGTLLPRLTLAESDFALSFEIGAGRADPAGVLRAFREGRSLVPLLDSGFAHVPADWLERYGEAIEDLLLAREGAGTAHKASVFDLAPAEELEGAAAAGLRALASSPRTSPSFRARRFPSLSAGNSATIRRGSTGSISSRADSEPPRGRHGPGKTIRRSRSSKPDFVAAPTSVLHNWMEEAARFRPDLSVCLYHGRDRKLDPEAISP
jgi:hypothetical protein